MERNHSSSVLLVRVPTGICAVPLTEVIETMRPLPVSPLSRMSDFVCGVSLIRGTPTPVVDLGLIFDANLKSAPGRFVTVRSGGRTVAVSVQSVIGTVELDGKFASISPLLKSARAEVIEAVGSIDAELVVVLQMTRLIPESVWETIGNSEVVR
jgi:purine-binding chemotaxis protein CheW